MDDFNLEKIKLTIQTDAYSVAPGGSLEIPLILANLAGAPDQVRISLEGIPLVWVSTEQPMVLLQPGEERQISLTIKPPAPPEAHTGRYILRLRAASTIDPTRTAQAQASLTVAGFEVKGRVGVLLDGLKYTVVPGEQLAVPVMMINQGLSPDTLQPVLEGLPEGWASVSSPALRLEPGEVKGAVLIVQPPRLPSSRAGRYPFRILVASQEAPDQSARVECTLTVAAFIDFKVALEAAQSDQNLPAQVMVQNLSNVPATFRVSWSSPEDSLTFEPGEPQQINISEGETAKVEYSARPTRRVWIGGELTYPYTVTVQASNQQTRTLEGSLAAKGLLPVWAAIAGAAALLLACLCLCLASGLTLRGGLRDLTSTKTPELTSTATVLLPTATQSQTDQKPLLVERNWYLVSYNDTRSSPGTQEPYNLFNPDGTLIGFTGCKDLSANYQTNFNQISISNLSLGRGTCPDATLQQQEDAFVAILRSARSYFVADTALQIAGEAGFLNYSLSSLDRPEEFPPPTAVIRAVPQSEAGQVVVFDGAASSGQVPIVSWKWDFGDGENASGAVVQHIYRNPGMYTASLTVTDQRGQTGSAAHQIHVLAQPLPTAQPTLPPPTAPPAQPTPTAEPQPEPPTATPEIPPEPATATPEPQPEPDPPQASISGPREGYIGEPVVFDASSSRPGGSPIVSYAWSFGNGQDQPASPDPSASTIYNQAGDYEVTVFVSDANGLSSNASTRIVIGARLDTAVWTLSGFNGQPLLPGTAITLQFLQGQLSGFAGCNTYNGGYTASDNGDGTYSVTIDRVSASRLSCPADLMAQESSYLTALQQATSAAVQENRLTLNYPNGALVFYLVSPQ